MSTDEVKIAEVEQILRNGVLDDEFYKELLMHGNMSMNELRKKTGNSEYHYGAYAPGRPTDDMYAVWTKDKDGGWTWKEVKQES